MYSTKVGRRFWGRGPRGPLLSRSTFLLVKVVPYPTLGAGLMILFIPDNKYLKS